MKYFSYQLKKKMAFLELCQCTSIQFRTFVHFQASEVSRFLKLAGLMHFDYPTSSKDDAYHVLMLFR